ncbi:MAG: adenosylcobinamide-GDP ribazoletransferase [Lachnospiraceae bacterium]|nr:adenosylcobinamide-GDP ribazoletransferase [Lachnospiraceae bacterium]
MLRTMIIAFSTYSKIPMPRFEWKKEDLRFTMCAFPLVGLAVALVQYGAYSLLTHFCFGHFFSAVILTLIPLILTGGIHMDGYMDTWDALCSYGDREKKLGILRDPHVGAFAVIHGICYIMLTTSLWHELLTDIDTKGSSVSCIYLVLSGYVLSRILSGLLALTLKKAKKEGMLNDMTEDGNDRARLILIFILTAFIFAILWFFRINAVFLLLPSALVTDYYRYMSYKRFGGITGDLAGWFLQVLELAVLIGALTAAKLQ